MTIENLGTLGFNSAPDQGVAWTRTCEAFVHVNVEMHMQLHMDTFPSFHVAASLLQSHFLRCM